MAVVYGNGCRPYYFKLFRGCLPQILLGQFLNTLNQILTRLGFEITEEVTGY